MGYAAIPYVIAAVATAASAVSAASSISQANAQAAEASYQGKVAANNALVAQQNHASTIAAGEAAAQRESLAKSAQLGAVRAAEAASDIDVNTGSAKDVLKSQRELGELDTQTTMNNALLTAYGYSTQATSFTAESQLKKSEVGADIAGGELSAAGGLLGSASSTAFKLAALDSGGGVTRVNTDVQSPDYTFT